MFTRKLGGSAPKTPTMEKAHASPRVETPITPPAEFSQPTTPRSPLTPVSTSTSASTEEPASYERGMVVVHESARQLAPAGAARSANSLALVTVNSISAEERSRLAHMELSKKMADLEAVHAREADIFIEKAMRDALADQYHAEARAEKKFDEEMAAIRYREAQLNKKIENMQSQMMAEKTRMEIEARQKLEDRKSRARTQAEERIAAAKARGSAVRAGVIPANLKSTRKRFSLARLGF